jgi:hypothetical protein
MLDEHKCYRLGNHSFKFAWEGGGVQTGSTLHVGPAPGDCEDGDFGGKKIGRGNRSARRKPASAPLCPPQIPLEQTRARTRAATVGSQRLTLELWRGLGNHSY